jgi:hypothetical protein
LIKLSPPIQRICQSRTAGVGPVSAPLQVVLALSILALGSCTPTASTRRTPTALGPSEYVSASSPGIAPGSPTSAPSPGPLTDATQAIVLEPPGLPPTPTPPIPPVNLPPESLTLFSPGPGSQVTSPIRISGRGGPSYDERIRLRLYGEDGTVLADHTTILFAYPGNAGRFVSQLSFQINGVAEAGRLEIESFDRRYNRVDHIATQSLVLLSTGSPLVHPALQPPEKLAIVYPTDGLRVTGGELQVRAAGWVDSDVPVSVELVDRSGQTMASTQAHFDAPKVGQLGTFTVSLAHDTPVSQFARVVLTERDPSGAYIVHLSSVEVYLQR